MLATNNHFLDVFDNRQLYQHLRHTAETGTPSQLEDDILTVEREKHTLYYKFAITPVISETEKVIGAILLLQSEYKVSLKSARNFARKRDFDNAIAQTKKAIGLDPSRPEAFTFLGQLQETLGDFASATKNFSLDPTYTNFIK